MKKSRAFPAALLIVASALLSACGQKGALYRADEKTPVVEPQAQTQTPTQKEKRPKPHITPDDSAVAPPAADPNRPAAPPSGI